MAKNTKIPSDYLQVKIPLSTDLANSKVATKAHFGLFNNEGKLAAEYATWSGTIPKIWSFGSL